jgi:glyoxylase-like metal-dependent hydrolase (beta-lactamase superfamily II)
VKVVPTPGHTLADVSVLVNTKDKGLVAVTGTLESDSAHYIKLTLSLVI